MARLEDYNTFDECTEVELFVKQEDSTPTHGSLKSFSTNDNGLVFYEKSAFTVNVKRLLQVDGFEDSTQKQRVTLFVLKVGLACNKGDQKIERVKFQMEFQDIDPNNKADPQILALAPFEPQEVGNVTKLDVEEKVAVNAQVSIGGGTSGAAGREKKTSWCESYVARAQGWEIIDKTSNKARGVAWSLQSNPKDNNAGVPSDITVAMLFSRSSDNPYLAKFKIDVTAGTFYNLTHNIKTALGLKPGTTKPFIVTPSETPLMYGRGGGDLLNRAKIEPNNLGELAGEGKLKALTSVGRFQAAAGDGDTEGQEMDAEA